MVVVCANGVVVIRSVTGAVAGETRDVVGATEGVGVTESVGVVVVVWLPVGGLEPETWAETT